jgi:hypothetical protein
MWCARLSDAQRDAVRALIQSADEPSPSLRKALEALELARWDDLPDAALPWGQVTELAAAQGIGEADVVWDLAVGLRAPGGGLRELPTGARGTAARRAAGGPGAVG